MTGRGAARISLAQSPDHCSPLDGVVLLFTSCPRVRLRSQVVVRFPSSFPVSAMAAWEEKHVMGKGQTTALGMLTAALRLPVGALGDIGRVVCIATPHPHSLLADLDSHSVASRCGVVLVRSLLLCVTPSLSLPLPLCRLPPVCACFAPCVSHSLVSSACRAQFCTSSKPPVNSR